MEYPVRERIRRNDQNESKIYSKTMIFHRLGDAYTVFATTIHQVFPRRAVSVCGGSWRTYRTSLHALSGMYLCVYVITSNTAHHHPIAFTEKRVRPGLSHEWYRRVRRYQRWNWGFFWWQRDTSWAGCICSGSSATPSTHEYETN